MGAIAMMVQGNGAAAKRLAPVKEIETVLERVLAALLEPVGDDLDVRQGRCTISGDELTLSAEWIAVPRDGRVRPFVIAYRTGHDTENPWRLERWRGGSIVEQVLLMGNCLPSEIALHWQRPEVREFVTRGMAPAKADDAPAVFVLAEWNGDGASEADEPQVLVDFENRAVVKALHAMVQEQYRVRVAGTARIAGRHGLRVLGASIEVDTPKVRAWRVEVVGELGEVKASLGDGVLLGALDAAVRCDEELEEVTLEVRDDGMLLVRSYGGFATIDLTALAAVSE